MLGHFISSSLSCCIVVTLTFSTAELTINEGVTDDTIQLLLDIPTEGIEENLTGVIVPNLISAESKLYM